MIMGMPRFLRIPGDGRYITVWLLLAILSACTFQQAQLSRDDSQPVQPWLTIGKLPSTDVMLLNGDGTIDEFRDGKLLWESDFKNIYVDELNDYMRVKAELVGDSGEFIYRRLNPWNFATASQVLISFNDLKDVPSLRFELVDCENGYIASLFSQTYNSSTLSFSLDSIPAYFDRERVCEMRIVLQPRSVYSGLFQIGTIRAK